MFVRLADIPKKQIHNSLGNTTLSVLRLCAVKTDFNGYYYSALQTERTGVREGSVSQLFNQTHTVYVNFKEKCDFRELLAQLLQECNACVHRQTSHAKLCIKMSLRMEG